MSVTTLVTNLGLGWWRGVWWAWLIHAANALLWVPYCLATDQYGLIPLSAATIVLDIATALRRWRPLANK